MSSVVAIFGSSLTQRNTQEWADAYEAGRRCADAGLAVMTGGYGGVMEAACQGAVEAGGHTIGVIAPAVFGARGSANSYAEEVIEANTLPRRLGALIELAQGTIALPGSIGTAAELLMAWNLNHIVRGNGGVRLPTVAIGDTWSRLVQMLGATGAPISEIELADTVEAAVDWLVQQPEILGRKDSTI